MAVRANTGQSPSYVSMLGKRQILLTGIKPAMACDAGQTLNRYWVGRPALCVPGTSYISDGGGNNRPNVEDILVSLVLSIIISWTFRILAHEEDQYSYADKILGHFFV